MGPAWAHGWVFCCAFTWAVTAPSAGSDCDTKWKESADVQMSPPPPTSVQVPLDTESCPAGSGPPMAVHDHGPGQTPGGSGGSTLDAPTVSRVTVDPMAWLCEVIPNPARTAPGMTMAWAEPGTAVQLTPSGDV